MYNKYMNNIITFGSATNDIFLTLAEKGGVVPGAKVKVERLATFSGGGGTNVACGLAKLGFKTTYLGKIGDDSMGQKVVDELQKCRVNSLLVKKDVKRQTALSVVVSSKGEDRAALVYHGACHFLERNEIPWAKLKRAKWLYIGPLREKTVKLLGPLVDFAKKNNIKVAINPSKEQKGYINMSTYRNIDILILNEEEAKVFGGVKKLTSLISGIVVVTKGMQGSEVYQQGSVWKSGIASAKIIEKTGAGDAYSSGFLAGLLLENDIEYAIQLGTANAAGCIQKTGAKNGLLTKKDLKHLPKVKIWQK